MPETALLVTYAQARRGVWGDGSSGLTVDWVYFLTDEVCQIVFGLPVGGAFTQSEDAFDVFERHTVWHVLSGLFVAANPQSGEVYRLRQGDSLAFGGDVWHHGFAAGSDPALVIEFTAPPPTRPPPSFDSFILSLILTFASFGFATASRISTSGCRLSLLEISSRPGSPFPVTRSANNPGWKNSVKKTSTGLTSIVLPENLHISCFHASGEPSK